MSGGNFIPVNPVSRDEGVNRVSMMDLWQNNINDTRVNAETVRKSAQNQQDAEASLDRKVRDDSTECRTCAARKYVDVSDDGGVSFQTPTHIPAAQSAQAVMSHEMEHVSRNSAQAKNEGGTATSSVSLQYAICPECGKPYVAGGVTTTITKTPVENPASSGTPGASGFKAKA